MEKILELLKTDPVKAIAKIEKQTKSIDKIKDYQKEYKNQDRTIRDSQVGNIQKDKIVGEGEKAKSVKTVRIPINFAKKIVTTSCAFEVGKPVDIIPSDDNNISKLLKQIWKVNRMDSLVQELLTLKKSETQGAIQFYIRDTEATSLLNKILAKIGLKTQKKEIKVKLLNNDSGVMTPYFEDNNLILFMWKYELENSEGKKVNHIEVWDKTNLHHYSDESGSIKLIEKGGVIAHGFDRIPIVYETQDEPEWFVVKEVIDRLETTISKLGASNDYSSYPLLQIYGEVQSFPDKDETGKVLQFPIKIDDEGKAHHGKAEFLVADNAAESQKLEIEKLESYIHYISHTPNIDFDNIKGSGSISGIALKLMFLDAIIKASMNEGKNRTTIERLLNIYISGIVNTTNTGLKTESQMLYFDINFNSILPDDLKEAVEIVSSAINAGVMSKKRGAEYLAMTDNLDDELKEIEKDTKFSKDPETIK